MDIFSPTIKIQFCCKQLNFLLTEENFFQRRLFLLLQERNVFIVIGTKCFIASMKPVALQTKVVQTGDGETEPARERRRRPWTGHGTGARKITRRRVSRCNVSNVLVDCSGQCHAESVLLGTSPVDPRTSKFQKSCPSS